MHDNNYDIELNFKTKIILIFIGVFFFLLAFFIALSSITFNFNETGGELGFSTDITYVGVSAQEVQEVLPEAVKPAPSDEKYITVQYEKIVPLLIEAIKELSDKVSALEDKLNK